jgi:hypothetical protein
MFKRTAMKYFPIAVLALLIAAILCMSRYADTRKQQHQENAKPVNPAASVTPDKATEGGSEANKAQNPPGWIDTFTWPDGVTGWALLLTLFVIAWQSVETRDAARAGLLNAQAVINAERPWMLVSVKSSPGEIGGFDVHVRNKGRTPAMVIEARMGCVAVKNVSDLPLPAIFPMDNPIKNKVIIPGGTAHIMWFDESLFKAILKDKLPRSSSAKQIFVHGRVLYRSLANPNKSVVHETRWICEYQFPSEDDEGNSIFRVEGIGVSDEYDRYS